MPRNTNTLLLLSVALVGLVAVAVFQFQISSIRSNAERVVSDMEATLNNDRSSIRTPTPRPIRSGQSAERLRRKLEERTDLYRNQLDQLARQSKVNDKLSVDYNELVGKYEKLQREYDQLWNDADASLNSVIGVLQEESVDDTSGEVDGNADDELAMEESTHPEDLQLHLDLTTWELEQASLRISELTAALGRESQVSMALSSVLIEVGAPATRLLTLMLTDQRPEVQAWAAWVLGHIRPVEVETKSALERLALDGNADVAKAAGVALENVKRN